MDLRELLMAGFTLRDQKERERELTLVCPNLTKAARRQTVIEDYNLFNEDNPDFKATSQILVRGDGLILSTTKFDEVQFLWNVPTLYVPAEAQLLRFHKIHGTYKNLICCGPELGDPAKVKLLSKITLRHAIIGITPIIVPFVDLKPGVE